MQDESRDPAIKLFGKRIHLPADGEISGISADEFEKAKCSSRESEEEEEQEIEKTEQDSLAENTTDTGQEDNNSLSNGAESTNPETLAEPNENPKTPSIDEESGKPKTGEIDKEQKDAGNSQEKTLKKPDKILPCPRCNSMDTKFCYYNNYNINQPRHFCKACQRYWTAGGTMRNVPVGAGRRKNKNSSSHYRHISISEALQAARIDAPHGTHHHPALKSNGKVLSFGVDAPISDYMASVLNLREKNVLSGTRNGFHCLEEQKPSVQCREEKGDDCTSGSSVTVSKSMDEEGKSCIQETMMGNINGFPSPIPCLPGMPWPYPWNPAMPPPAFCPSAYPMPFYPAAPYWSCGIPGAWNIPLLSPQSSSSSNMKAPTSGPNSPRLGKHSREGDTVKLDDSEKEKLSKQKNGSVLVPKTLRIDDPSEAAKSSIWATLGIKNESLSGGGLYKAFHPKGNEKNHIAEASPALRANPAALSRSINFHESS